MKSCLLRLTLAACVMTAAHSAVAADTYPSHPIKIVVNTAPGGFTDLMARLAAQHMSDYLKQPVVVENRAGGDGMIAIRFVKSASADGYTLLAATGTAAQQMALRLEPGYDLVKDFTGIGIVSRTPFLMEVAPSSPDKTAGDFIARAKANPNKLSYASAGVGTVPHFATERFLQQMGAQVRHIPYKGNAPALPDVMTGRVDMIFDTFNSSIGQVKAGQFRVLGVTSATRLPAMPDVPTLAEQGAPNYSYYTWTGIFAPAGTPPDVVARLGQAMQYVRSQDSVKDRFRKEGMEAVDLSPEQFNQFLAREVAQNQKIVADLHLEKQQ
ncbi:MAG TPA: tripartite tricarboxylate transporter substrate binding protein [Burkholderiales bacterium]|nr:tripartite tricarboxylate transporter substrate binding protein [Burkholderiales bacterium]